MKLNEVVKSLRSSQHRLHGDEATRFKKAVLKHTGGSVSLFDTNDLAQAVEVNLNKAHDPDLTAAVLKHLVKKVLTDMGYDLELVNATVRTSFKGATRWARVVFHAKTKP